MSNKRAIFFFWNDGSTTDPGFYLFKVSNRSTKNTRVKYEMCLKLTVRTPERRE